MKAIFRNRGGFKAFLEKEYEVVCEECGEIDVKPAPNTKYCSSHRRGKKK